jgi:integrase
LRGQVNNLRNPNGYGTCARLSGNRRNPFVVRKTKGWDDRGYPIYATIGYFPTREAGLIALAQYNANPWDVGGEKTTLEELYALWETKKAHKLGTSNLASLKAAYNKHCTALHKIKYRDIKAYHMQEAIDNCVRGPSTQSAIKNLFYHLDRFALEMDLITRQYSALLTCEPAPDTSKQPFSSEEINALWDIATEPWVDSVLVFLYTGFRISELLNVKMTDIDLDQMTITGGVKTKAGKDRVVPIHSLIAEIVRRRVSEGGEYLYSIDGKKLTPVKYYPFWNAIMARIGAKHKPHECRHTFRSLLDSAGANKRCIDLIMGHKSQDVGERIYTHKTIQELRDAIELVTR